VKRSKFTEQQIAFALKQTCALLKLSRTVYIYQAGCGQECLNAHWFCWRMPGARLTSGGSTIMGYVPTSALQWATPAEFARQARENPLSGRPEEPEFSILDRY
jgi:hypothetical protein